MPFYQGKGGGLKAISYDGDQFVIGEVHSRKVSTWCLSDSLIKRTKKLIWDHTAFNSFRIDFPLYNISPCLVSWKVKKPPRADDTFSLSPASGTDIKTNTAGGEAWGMALPAPCLMLP